MITFQHAEVLTRHTASLIAICSTSNPSAHNYWEPVADNEAGRRVLRERIRRILASGVDVSGEQFSLLRQFATEVLDHG